MAAQRHIEKMKEEKNVHQEFSTQQNYHSKVKIQIKIFTNTSRCPLLTYLPYKVKRCPLSWIKEQNSKLNCDEKWRTFRMKIGRLKRKQKQWGGPWSAPLHPCFQCPSPYHVPSAPPHTASLEERLRGCWMRWTKVRGKPQRRPARLSAKPVCQSPS